MSLKKDEQGGVTNQDGRQTYNVLIVVKTVIIIYILAWYV